MDFGMVSVICNILFWNDSAYTAWKIDAFWFWFVNLTAEVSFLWSCDLTSAQLDVILKKGGSVTQLQLADFIMCSFDIFVMNDTDLC
jgi:hypothetical protein